MSEHMFCVIKSAI